MLGLESRVRYHVLDVLEERVALDDALVRDKRSTNLVLLAAAQAREKEDVDIGRMIALVETLRERYDYVLIDSPAGIEHGFRTAAAGAQEAIVVCMPEVSSVRDADRVVGLLPNSMTRAVDRQPPAAGDGAQAARCFRSRTSTRSCVCRCWASSSTSRR